MIKAIMVVLKVSSYELAVILAIMNFPTFNAAVILYSLHAMYVSVV